MSLHPKQIGRVASLGNMLANGALVVANEIESHRQIILNQTTAGIVATLPTPLDTNNTVSLVVSNIGTAAITVQGAEIGAGKAMVYAWTGAAWNNAGAAAAGVDGSNISLTATPGVGAPVADAIEIDSTANAPLATGRVYAYDKDTNAYVSDLLVSRSLNSVAQVATLGGGVTPPLAPTVNTTYRVANTVSSASITLADGAYDGQQVTFIRAADWSMNTFTLSGSAAGKIVYPASNGTLTGNQITQINLSWSAADGVWNAVQLGASASAGGADGANIVVTSTAATSYPADTIEVITSTSPRSSNFVTMYDADTAARQWDLLVSRSLDSVAEAGILFNGSVSLAPKVNKTYLTTNGAGTLTVTLANGAYVGQQVTFVRGYGSWDGGLFSLAGSAPGKILYTYRGGTLVGDQIAMLVLIWDGAFWEAMQIPSPAASSGSVLIMNGTSSFFIASNTTEPVSFDATDPMANIISGLTYTPADRRFTNTSGGQMILDFHVFLRFTNAATGMSFGWVELNGDSTKMLCHGSVSNTNLIPGVTMSGKVVLQANEYVVVKALQNSGTMAQLSSATGWQRRIAFQRIG